MATPIEATVTFFANPYLVCVECQHRAVGVIGPVAIGRNWPCYHVAGRESACDNWTPETGCQHDHLDRQAHYAPEAYRR